MHRRISGAVTVLVMAALILTGCTSEASSISSAKGKTEKAGAVDTGFTMSTVGSYDSADTAVVLSTDEANKAVTFINMDTGKQYTLYYDGTTYVKDKHDGPMTISQIEPGDVVDVTFLKGKKKLASIQLSPEAWVYDDVYNYDLAGANRTASIGSQSYSLPESVVVLSEGRRVDKAEVVSQDVVTISGIGHKIYSINVDRGHGYLSLKNEQPLLGGWIEVGNSTIRQVSEDMLLVVPEGTYQVVLNNNGIGCVKDVTIERDKEVVLDVDDIEIPEDATGKILFSVTPENATVSVDGKPVDIGKAVELSYGIHRVEASASGYDTLTKHIQVGSEYATISFKLEETRKEDSDSVSGNSITRDPWEDTYSEPADVSSVSDNTSVSENALRSSQNTKIDVIVKDSNNVELENVTVDLEIKDSDGHIIYDRSKKSPCNFSKDKNAHIYRFALSKEGYAPMAIELKMNAQENETCVFTLTKSGTTSSNVTNKGFSNGFISAIATTVANCSLTNGIEVYIPDPPKDNMGNFEDSGLNAVKETVKSAVQKMVGLEKINDYYFEIKKTLGNVNRREDGNYDATVEITVQNKSEYKEAIIPVDVVIKKKVEEKKISVIVKPDKNEVAPGDTVTFTAEVKDLNSETTIDDAEVSWSHSDINIDAWFMEDGSSLTLQVNSVESTIELTVTATYTDADGDPFESAPQTVIIKASEEEPETPDPDDEDEGDKGQDGTSGDNQSGEDQSGTGGDNQDGTNGDNQNGEDQGGTSGDNQNGESQGSINGSNPDGDNSNIETQSFSMTQQSHPIRNFFSSLFK